MGIIFKLSTTVANKIAAGEVIERPASVVKELLENAIDAESSRIEIDVEDGGKRLIRVTDNGTGMAPDDLEMSVQSHATSKLRDSDDLFFITTLGFRGEAVPSIGAVSDMRIASRMRAATAGAEVRMSGGTISPIKAAGAPEGTIVEVRNLFFNIPARRKFLKATATELSHIVDAVTKMSLAYPAVGFRLTHNGREVFNCLAGETRLRRIAHFFGKELQDELLEVNSGDGPLTINGFVAPPSQTRANTRLQYVFLNGRFIRDKTIASAIRSAYEGKIPGGRQPIVALFLQIDPREVDVNVHPTKHEVRFRNSQMIYVSVRRIIDSKLATASAPRIDPARQYDRPQQLDTSRQPAPRPQPSANTPAPPERRPPAGSGGWNTKIHRQPELFDPTLEALRQPPAAARPPWDTRQPDRLPGDRPAFDQPPPQQPAAIQVHDSYLIQQTPRGIIVIDQHALHERILYDRISRRLARAPLESQRLLIPATVDLTRDEVIILAGAADAARLLGFEIEQFGHTTIALRTVPTLLQGIEPAEVLHDLLDHLQQDHHHDQAPELREKLMRMIACKAAVKANQRLSGPEITSLIEHARALGPAATCPHGRPTTLSLSLDDLEKHFLRK